MGQSGRFGNVPVPAEYPVVLAVAAACTGSGRGRCPAKVERIGVWDCRWSPRVCCWPPGRYGRRARSILRIPTASSASVHAVSRNPMCLGWMLASAGVGVVAGASWVMAGVPLAAVRIHREVLREEGRLAALFGAEFEGYCECVPRYWPVRRMRGGQ